MTSQTQSAPIRRFSAHGVHERRNQSHDVFGVSFEDAALDFIDRWRPVPDEDGEIQVQLTDCETGERQCLIVDLEGGEIGSCD
ncbi:DUF5961 family protein [Phenylobacterium sp. LH3H17]|uniref:DUF5961 family protein n=1 Tax=Phenylobacterium sp. LH3H17 TaxID=2903901 RepID=UPI0020C96DA9|nr:DUF5961 family protein [Phenylobacterium sp. LH3H17]UTP40058.1 DUF5961 family protein [Phenylobacterium sp. LH3H17]